jgi:large subunit GTPase 1
MVLAKSKNAVGLGNRYGIALHGSVSMLMHYSLMNDRFGKGKGADRKKVTSAGIHRINHATGETVGCPSKAAIQEN